MIIFGSGSKELLTEHLPDVSCPHCQVGKTVVVNISSKHFHIFWIPIFPYSKNALTVCGHCKQVLTEEEMEPSLQEIIQEKKSTVKHSIVSFIGLLIIAALFVLGFIGASFDKSNEIELIKDPKVGDVYTVKFDDSAYTLHKIIEVNNEEVVFAPNIYEVNTYSGADDLDEPDNYLDEASFTETINRLIHQRESGYIRDIDRQ